MPGGGSVQWAMANAKPFVTVTAQPGTWTEDSDIANLHNLIRSNLLSNCPTLVQRHRGPRSSGQLGWTGPVQYKLPHHVGTNRFALAGIDTDVGIYIFIM